MPFNIHDKVFSDYYGYGVVDSIAPDMYYSIVVTFDSGNTERFTDKGLWNKKNCSKCIKKVQPNRPYIKDAKLVQEGQGTVKVLNISDIHTLTERQATTSYLSISIDKKLFKQLKPLILGDSINEEVV